MSTLKAFVGHSFTKEDEDIVNAILEYFTQIKKMDIGFSWEHAREAEPKVLADKVMEIIEDKNLFIGICTKKEKVIERGNLKSRLLSRGMEYGKSEDFSWKTSDWIIQEIGLAFGREMHVILLVEEGLRSPGGFQGNLEYIEFSRDAPEKSFGRILEMIRALLPKAKQIHEAANETLKSTVEEVVEEGDEWITPKPEWSRHNYNLALMHTVDDKEAEQKICDAYLQTEEGKETSNIDSWSAVKEYTHLWLANDGSLSRLEALAKDKPENSDVQKYLALAYQQFDEEEKAASLFLKAASNETDKTSELLRMGDAAKSYAKSNKNEELSKLIFEIKEKSNLIENGEIQLLEILKDIADIQKDKVTYLACLERLLDLKPDDHDSRFNLAYGHSEEGRRALALFHYLKVPYQNRGGVLWNNVGVSYSELELYGKSIDAYRLAEEKDETLAMDNIARKLLNTGFLSEAEELCDKAKTFEDYNKNIDDTSFRLKKKKEEEKEKVVEILDEIKPVHKFYVKYGRASARNILANINGIWDSNQCPLQLEISEGKLTAHGTYEVISLGSIFANKASGHPATKDKYEISYEGDVTGYAVKGTVRVSKPNETLKSKGLLEFDDDKKNVLMIFSDDMSRIDLYKDSATYDADKFQNLIRVIE